MMRAEKGEPKPFGRHWRLVLPWMLGGYWLAALVATHTPADRLAEIHASDKLAHFAGYAVLAGLFWLTLRSRGVAAPVRVVVLAPTLAAYGMADEVSQAWVNRHPSVADWAFDILGVAAAISVMEAWAALGRARRTG